MQRSDYPWDDKVRVSELLSRALDLAGLGGLVELDQAALSLAEALGLDTGHTPDGLLAVLTAMLEPLEVALEDGPLDSIQDVDARRAPRVVEQAVKGPSLDDIVTALNFLGRRTHNLRTSPGTVQEDLRTLLASTLSERLRKTFEVWRRKNVWPAASQPRKPALQSN